MPDLSFKVGADISGLKSGLSQARNEITRALGSIGGIGGLLTGAGLVAGATKAVTDHVERAKEIAKLAQLANASVAEASKLLATGNQFGATGDAIATAMKNISKAAAQNPEDFKAIGVATEDASGKSRRAIDIFNDLRQTLAGGANDYKTTAAAAAILGRSVQDLYPFLRASEAQVQATTAAAAEMGLVMSEDDVAAALAFAGSMKVVEAQGNAVSQMIAVTLIPMLANLTEAAFQAKDMLETMFSTGGGASGWDNFMNNLRDIGLGNNIGRGPVDANGVENVAANKAAAIARLQVVKDKIDQLAKIRADFARLSQANLTGAGGDFEFPTLSGGGKGRDTVADALHDRIDAIKETAKEQDQATRDALQGYEREKQAVIDATSTEKDVVRKGFEVRIQQLQDLADEEDLGHRMRERVRDDETSALREQTRGTQELIDLERSRADVADAEAAAASERNVEIFRSAGQSQNEYGRAVRDQQRRISDADKRVAETKKKLEEDTAKSAIEARIRAIDAERAADTRLMEDKRTASDELLKGIRRQSDEQQAAYQARIDGMQTELKAEQQRVADIIEAESRKTDAVVLDLEKELQEHTRVAAAVGAAWDYATRPRTIVVTATGDLSAVAAGAAGTNPRMGGIREFAGGGAGIITSPTLLVNARTGIPFASVAENGPEPFAFGRGRGGGDSINVNAYGIGVAEAARLIARENERMLARRAARGSGRNR